MEKWDNIFVMLRPVSVFIIVYLFYYRDLKHGGIYAFLSTILGTIVCIILERFIKPNFAVDFIAYFITQLLFNCFFGRYLV